jgi:hypothetical protein
MTDLTTTAIPRQGRTLDQLDDADRYLRFDELQRTMAAVWESIQLDVRDESVVVVPSVSLEHSTATGAALVQATEERALFLLLLLRQPHLHLVYVTSMPVHESVVEYYLGLLPGVIPRHARARLHMVPVGDTGPEPLSAKLLSRPRLLRRIRELVPNPAHSHLIPYNTTALERDIAISLGIPMFGADPRFAPLGSKTGCRRVFEDTGVPHPLGVEDLHTVGDVVDAVREMRARRPGIKDMIAKFNDGVSGAGNASISLEGLPAPGAPGEAEQVEARVRGLSPEDPTIDAAGYLEVFAADGGIVEERISGVEVTSPSVQMRVLPDRSLQLLSTHDQLLGGRTGQSYLGCVFPADPAYSSLISHHAMTIGRHLASLGVLGRFAVDFVVVRGEDGGWTPYAIELNLRKGGTTHPFLTLQFLTNGTYDPEGGMFLTATGDRKFLVATDHLEDEALRALTIDDLFDVVVEHGLHFDHARQTGVVFHMISSLTEKGRIGLTAVGDTPLEARSIHERAESLLIAEGRQALHQGPVVS